MQNEGYDFDTAGGLLELLIREALNPDARPFEVAGFEVTTGVGGHGVVGVLRNGKGPTVLIRADMDALPVEEKTGLPYASKVTTVDDLGATVLPPAAGEPKNVLHPLHIDR